MAADGDIKPVPHSPEPLTQARDDLASKEQKLFATADDGRRETLKVVIHSVVVLAIRIAAISAFAVFVVRMFHMIVPTAYRWLDTSELQNIDHLLFSGVLGGLIGKHLDKVIASKKE